MASGPAGCKRRDGDHEGVPGTSRAASQPSPVVGSVCNDPFMSLRVSILTREYPPHIYGGAGVHVGQLVPQLRALMILATRGPMHLTALAEDMAAGYRQGFNAGLDNMRGVADRTILMQRVIKAPVPVVWGAWMNAESLPKWWGPDGFSCRTNRIDLRAGGEWVFDMIAPDGTVVPNHHRYGGVIAEARSTSSAGRS